MELIEMSITLVHRIQDILKKLGSKMLNVSYKKIKLRKYFKYLFFQL